MKMVIYYAVTDENGVLCVEQLDHDDDEVVLDFVTVATLAAMFPDVIYFGVEVS